MVKLESRYIALRHSYYVTDVRYGGKPPSPTFPVVETGDYLPRGKSFPMITQPPLASFKTYTAMCNAGMKVLADQLLQENSRSWISTEHVHAGVLKFAGKPPPRIEDPIYTEILDELRDQFDVSSKIHPYTMDKAAKSVPQGTSPGLPYIITHQGKKKGQIYELRSQSFKNYWDRVGKGKPVVPMDDSAAFARSHISDPSTNKVRPVWCTPLKMIVQEARFALPITKGLIDQDYGHNTCYGMEMMKGGMAWLNTQLLKAKLQDPDLTCLMTDYSSFDSTVPAWMIRDVFNIFLEKIDLNYEVDETGKKIELNPEEEKRKFKKVIDYFINTPIRMNDGTRFQKRHGVPSGSVFTNIVDTAVNFIVSRYVQRKVFGRPAIFDLYFGDDGLMVLPGNAVVDIDKCIEVVKTNFGLILSTKKSYHTQNLRNVKILGYFNNYGDPVKPTKELILSMLYPQRRRDDWEYCITRALGCLLASGGGNNTVFLVAQAVFVNALMLNREIEPALDRLMENPRAKRHLTQMGCGEVDISPRFFFDQSLSVPMYNCTKAMKSINLVH